MKKVGICAITSKNNNFKKNSNISLSKYREKCTLNTIMNMAQNSLKQSDNNITQLGIYNNIDKALSDCKRKGIDTLYITSKDVIKDMKADTNGIDVMYF